MILALETSCDDTCAAVVGDNGTIHSNVIASQGLLHSRYGGVVPEVAARNHLEVVNAVVGDALERAEVTLADVERVAVTSGPGLIAALLVGVSTAKALAAARRLPLAPVNHLHGHVVASTLEAEPIEPPYLCLVASGGHTFLARVERLSAYELLGQTLDDAAGEAFDKGARMLGLPYPGGPEIDRLAREGDPAAFDFPRSAPGGDGSLDFSFSGLKTALLYAIRDLGGDAAAERRRRPRRLLPARDRGRPRRAAARRRRAGGGRARRARRRRRCELRAAQARGRALRRARRSPVGPAARALHRQRRDDRRRRAPRRVAGLPWLPDPRRHRQARLSTPRVTLYGKAGCHLCDDARAAVAAAREQVEFELEEVDISLDPGLAHDYGERIPVIAVDGEEVVGARCRCRRADRPVATPSTVKA